MKNSIRIVFFCAAFIVAGGLSLTIGGANVASAHTSRSQAIPVAAHYLALGDSAAFGYQPNGDFTHGYANDVLSELHQIGAQDMKNFSCIGETSTTFFVGGCPFAAPGSPSQLVNAINYLVANPGTIDPITLQIGANDVLPAFNLQTCAVNDAQFTSSLTLLDRNLKLSLAFLNAAHQNRSDIILMNYYDPYQNRCPNTVSYIQTLNQHLANDVIGFGQIADVFAAFGGAAVPNPYLCNDTWICSSYTDIHPTTLGYLVMSGAIEKVVLS